MTSRKILIIHLFFLLVFCNSCFVIRKGNNKNYQEFVQTAQKELPQVLDKIPSGYEELYGFHNRGEFLNTKVDEPFSTYTLEDNELKNTSSYRVPITIDNEFRALATVEYVKDTLHIVDFGATVLAKEIQTVCKENSSLKFEGILRAYSISSDFLIMSKKQENLFIPLTSAKKYLESIGISSTEKYYTKDQIINFLKNRSNE